MATTRKPDELKRKLIAFDPETWHALNLLARDQMKSFQELADEAFSDLLRKHERPVDLKAALRASAQQASAPTAGTPSGSADVLPGPGRRATRRPQGR